ncbi:hypothetical protein K1T71_014805 [Dendrolimus kikuchii]|nr:hypothetical protein K1T71_014805 [Dendrolimus kikuchii]
MKNNTDKQSVRDVNGQSKNFDIAMGPQVIKPKLKKSIHTEDAISINGMNKAQVDEFNDFFDKYENLSHNKSSDSEVIDDGRYIDIKATCSLKEQFSKVTDAKPFKGPFVNLVNSDGEETIISTNDDETIKTLNENIDDDTVEIETDKILDTEYFSDETEIKNSVKDKLENAAKFSNMDACFENQRRRSLLRDMPQTTRQKICSCSSNIDRNTNTFQNDFEVTDNFLRSKKIDSEVEAKDIDKSTFETPNFEKIIQACTETVLTVLQNQIPLPNKEELNKTVPHNNQVSTYGLKQSEQALNIQGITNKLLKDIDMQDTAIVKNLKINETIPTQMLRTDLEVLDRENCATNSYQARRNCNIPTVEKNKKLYAKRSFKSDAEKHNFTKGPTLYEKSIVLPQILKRLALRKAKFNEENKFVRRLILDDPSENFNNAANITNNKANITDASPNIKKPNTPNTFVNTIDNNKEVNIKHNTKTTNNFKVTNAVIDNIRLPKENILSKNMPVTKSNKPGDCAGTSTNNVTNSNTLKVNTSAGLEGVSKSTENNAERVELNPEILLEDCNKERLLEWKRRQWLREFVQ